jgi:hypothetical protein
MQKDSPDRLGLGSQVSLVRTAHTLRFFLARCAFAVHIRRMDIRAEVRAIDARRKAAGMNRTEFCRRTHIHLTTWMRWREGTALPSMAAWLRVQEIAQTLPEPAEVAA